MWSVNILFPQVKLLYHMQLKWTPEGHRTGCQFTFHPVLKKTCWHHWMIFRVEYEQITKTETKAKNELFLTDLVANMSLSASSQAFGFWAGAPDYIRCWNAPHEVLNISEWQHWWGAELRNLKAMLEWELYFLPLNLKSRFLSCGCFIWLHSQTAKQDRTYLFHFEFSSANLFAH